jgi:hypothetical protein
MARSCVPAAALCALAGAPAGAQKVARYEQDGWALNVRHDDFTGLTSCSMLSTDRRIVVQPAAIGFRFAKGSDTFHAWYQVDGAAAQRWQDMYSALIMADADIDGPGLDDPTGGVMWLPTELVRTAREVTVRLHDRGDARMFRLQGLDPMLAAADRLGCPIK